MDRLRRRLGGRPLLHRLRAAARRLHHGPVRGQAGGHAGRGRVLAGDRRARGAGAVHRADRVPGDPARRTRPASTRPSTTCPGCGRCSWPASGSTRRPTSGPRTCSASRSSTTGGRPRPAGRSRPTRAGLEPLPVKAGLADRADARLGRAGPRPGRRAGARGRGRRDRHASCRCRRGRCRRCGRTTSGTSSSYLSALPGLLPDRRRRARRRRRLPVRHGPHRRRDQRRRAPAVHRGDGGGAGRAPGGGRVRGDRRRRRAEGSGAARVRGAQGRASTTDPGGRRRRAGAAGARARSARWRRCAGSTWSRRCPRPGRARSCAGRCAAIADGVEQPVPSTIEDAAVLDALRPTLRS